MGGGQVNSGWWSLWTGEIKEKENVTTEEKHYIFQKGKILGLRDREGKRQKGVWDWKETQESDHRVTCIKN